MQEGFRDLIVWQRAIQLTTSVYQVTGAFPKEELYGLTSQLRRASVSIASNIAEGWGRQSGGEYRHFLGIARGSNLELQTQLVIARELGFARSEKMEQCESLSFEVARMLVALMKSIKAK